MDSNVYCGLQHEQALFYYGETPVFIETDYINLIGPNHKICMLNRGIAAGSIQLLLTHSRAIFNCNRDAPPQRDVAGRIFIKQNGVEKVARFIDR